MQAVDDEWRIGIRVANRNANLRSLGDPDERTRDLESLSFLGERSDQDARFSLAVRMPFALSHLQPNGEDPAPQRAGRDAVVVRADAIGSNARGQHRRFHMEAGAEGDQDGHRDDRRAHENISALMQWEGTAASAETV